MALRCSGFYIIVAMMNAYDEVHGRFSISLCMVIFFLSFPPPSVCRAFYAIENNDIIIFIIIIYWRHFNLCHTMRECISIRSFACIHT